MGLINHEDILAGKIRSLSKAITLCESKKPEHKLEAEALIEKLLPHTGNSIRIGISGVPGVGKSSFIETLGLYLISLGHKVAVLAIDPSSPISGGSILGDKTRMEKLSQSDKAFIRPTPTSGELGGVAQKTREAMLLCEAAGFDVILVETVGVGQSEFSVSDMVDIFTVLLLPGGGDELQGIKKGIIEVADLILINKSEGDNQLRAQTTQAEYTSALNIVSKNSFFKTKVRLISALNNIGISEFWEDVHSYKEKAEQENVFSNKRNKQNKKWLKSLFFELIQNKIATNDNLQTQWKELEERLSENKLTAYSCAHKMLDILLKD